MISVISDNEIRCIIPQQQYNNVSVYVVTIGGKSNIVFSSTVAVPVI